MQQATCVLSTHSGGQLYDCAELNDYLYATTSAISPIFGTGTFGPEPTTTLSEVILTPAAPHVCVYSGNIDDKMSNKQFLICTDAATHKETKMEFRNSCTQDYFPGFSVPVGGSTPQIDPPVNGAYFFLTERTSIGYYNEAARDRVLLGIDLQENYFEPTMETCRCSCEDHPTPAPSPHPTTPPTPHPTPHPHPSSHTPLDQPPHSSPYQSPDSPSDNPPPTLAGSPTTRPPPSSACWPRL